jgi:hypothetical protein
MFNIEAAVHLSHFVYFAENSKSSTAIGVLGLVLSEIG